LAPAHKQLQGALLQPAGLLSQGLCLLAGEEALGQSDAHLRFVLFVHEAPGDASESHIPWELARAVTGTPIESSTRGALRFHAWKACGRGARGFTSEGSEGSAHFHDSWPPGCKTLMHHGRSGVDGGVSTARRTHAYGLNLRSRKESAMN